MTETNQALLKYLEEKHGGLASEEPLVATELSRKNCGGAMRMDSFSIILKELHDISEDHMNAALAKKEFIKFD